MLLQHTEAFMTLPDNLATIHTVYDDHVYYSKLEHNFYL